MKRILAAACNDPDAVYKAAFLVAERFEAHVVGLGGAWPRQTFMSWNDNAGLVSVEGALLLELEEEERIRKARKSFLAIASERDIPLRHIPRGQVGTSAEWRHVAIPGEGAVGSFGRTFDLIVVEQPMFVASFAQARLDGAILDSGRPVLMTTARSGATLGTRVAIVWKGSVACARSIALAMPLLRKAEHAEILSLQPETPALNIAELECSLAAQMTSVSVRHVRLEGRSEGDAMLSAARAVNADLLVAGAYAGGRFRELLTGGMTKALVRSAGVPVLFAY